MKELIQFLAGSLVGDLTSVAVEEHIRKGAYIYKLSTNKEDMGKLIGKQGRIAKAMRSVVGAAAAKENIRVIIDIG